MLANNETGAVQPLAEAAEIVHAAGGLLHVDAIQALGKIPFDIKGLNADLITISGHKIGGPKGAGAVLWSGRSNECPFENVPVTICYDSSIGAPDAENVPYLRDRGRDWPGAPSGVFSEAE